MDTPPRLSLAGMRILRLFFGDPGAEITGAQIIRASGLASGTVYPLLLRFERVGFLESHWESGNPSDLGHPRRRYYRISRDGLAVARKAFQELSPVVGAFSPKAV
jgi:PadR family transcriptional regulator PadR